MSRYIGLRHLAAGFCLCALVGCGDGGDAGEPEAAAPNDESAPETKASAAQSAVDGKADFSFDLCDLRGWYGDGECDWFCSRPDPDCALPPLGPEPRGDATRYPIVLLHGFNAGRSGPWSFYDVAETLADDGHVVYSTEVPAFASVEDRAGWLAEQISDIQAIEGAARVNLIAHSMGGLDARYLISKMGFADDIASLTSISTPHRGSRVADVALGLIPGKADDAVDFFATALARSYNDIVRDADVQAALTALSETACERFNAEVRDADGVYYQSWAGVSSVLGIANPLDYSACDGRMLAHPGEADRMNPLLVAGAAIIGGAELVPNDGMVTIESAKWGHFKGCVPADHLDEVGQPERQGVDPETGFDHRRFYRNLAYDLADRGF